MVRQRKNWWLGTSGCWDATGGFATGVGDLAISWITRNWSCPTSSPSWNDVYWGFNRGTLLEFLSLEQVKNPLPTAQWEFDSEKFRSFFGWQLLMIYLLVLVVNYLGTASHWFFVFSAWKMTRFLSPTSLVTFVGKRLKLEVEIQPKTSKTWLPAQNTHPNKPKYQKPAKTCSF